MGMRGPKPTYRWSRWFSRGAFDVLDRQHGCSRESFVQQMRNAASRRGLSLRVTQLDDGVRVVVRPKRLNVVT